ncbi:MAG: HAD family hydrolase [Gemmataceae bacterium]|nr:HAD family hydrolase [Gemmataceae bacterium]
MALTLEQYTDYLDGRDYPWPAPPEVERPRARPHLKPLPQVRAVTWSCYGTLLAISGGDLVFEHPQKFMMELALEKTVQEFKMWGSMSRKPGQPSEYMGQLYANALTELRVAPSPGEKYPEIAVEKAWESILKKLLKKDYKFDAGFFGSLNEYSRKIAYFFHASLQGVGCYPGAAAALRALQERGVAQGLLADGQCFTIVQLQRGLARQDEAARLDDFIDPEQRALSCDVKARKPSERLFRHALEALAQRGISPAEVLHVGSRIDRDIVPARRLGMRTALFAGDKASLQATPEQLKDPASRPDVLLTELGQVADVVPGP